jgi:hypothetical protein
MKTLQERSAIIADIAKQYLHIETLDVRHSDRLDFHEVFVRDIHDALLFAYNSGQIAALDDTIEQLKQIS